MIKKMDSINGNEIERLEDSALDGKISRTKRELDDRDRMGVRSLPDDRKTYLMQSLKTLLAERARRNQLQPQKVDIEIPKTVNGNEIERLEDSALDGKISRTKRELDDRDRMGVRSLPDDRKTYLMQSLKTLLAERARRNQLQLQKAETSKAAAARRSEMIEEG